MILRWTWPSYNDSAIRNVSRANDIGISYLDNVSSRDVSYFGIIVFFGHGGPGRVLIVFRSDFLKSSELLTEAMELNSV